MAAATLTSTERKARFALRKEVKRAVGTVAKSNGWKSLGGGFHQMCADWTVWITHDVSVIDSRVDISLSIKPIEADMVFGEIWNPKYQRRSLNPVKFLRHAASVESCFPMLWRETVLTDQHDAGMIAQQMVAWAESICKGFEPPSFDWYLDAVEQHHLMTYRHYPDIHADQICALITCGKTPDLVQRMNDVSQRLEAIEGPKLPPSSGFSYAGGKSFFDLTNEFLTRNNHPLR